MISTNGAVLNNYLLHDAADTGMDFFFSVLFTNGAEPYSRYQTLYPPLANLFYYLINLCIPETLSANWHYDSTNWTSLRHSSLDLRLWQAPFFIFICYNLITTIFTMHLFRKTIKEYSDLLGCALIFSSGMLFAWERGNIIIPTMLLVLYFILNYRCAGIKKELALISLSVAIGIKLYPIIFGLILLKNRMYKEIAKVFLYSMSMVLVPLIYFGGIESLYTWIEVIKNHGAGDKILIGHSFYSLSQIVIYFLKSFEHIVTNAYFLLLLRICVLIIAVVLLSNFWNTKKEWKAYLSLSLILVLSQQNSPMYNTIFFIIPFIYFVNEEQFITRNNLWYFMFFVIWLVPIGVLDSRKLYTVLKMASLVILAGSFVVFEIKRWGNDVLSKGKNVD